MNTLREWKKVYESDLESLIYELKEFLTVPAAVILSGEVGVGKTTFIKAFINQVETHAKTFSPTYSVVNEVGHSVHADFYRLNSEEEVLHLELPMYLEEAEYFFIEWGKEYIKQLYREVPEDFSFYELLFETNPIGDQSTVPSRNIRLIRLPQK